MHEQSETATPGPAQALPPTAAQTELPQAEPPQADSGEEDDAGFDKAFAAFAVAGKDTVPPAGDAPENAAAQETQAQPVAPDSGDADASNAAAGDDDIWANASEAQRNAYEAARREAEERERRLRGSVSGLARQVNELKAQIAAAGPQADAGATDDTSSKNAKTGEAASDPNATASEDDAAFRELANEYPELSGVLKKLFKNRDATVDNLRRENAELRVRMGSVSDAEAARVFEGQEQLVAERHPDYAQICGSADFTRWLETQPVYVQEAAMRNGEAIHDGFEAAHIIDLFKSAGGIAGNTPEPTAPADNAGRGTTQQTAAKRQRQLEAATTSSSRGPGAATGAPEDFEHAFDYFARGQTQQIA